VTVLRETEEQRSESRKRYKVILTYIHVHTYIQRLSTTLRYSLHAYIHSNFKNRNDGRISKNSVIASSSYKYTHTYIHTYMFGY